MDKFDALRTALTTDAAFRTVAVGLVCVAAIVVVWSQSRSTVMSMVVTVAITGVGQVPMRAAFAAVQAKLDGQTVTSAPCTDVTAILATIRQLESGGNYQAEAKGASASGAYQFVDGTWAGFGGFGHAADAPPSVQDAKAAEMVTAILATQPVEQVPLVWYTGHPISDPTELDTIPRPDAGNKLTPRQYRAKWLTEYTRQAASCSSAASPVRSVSSNDGWALPIPRDMVSMGEWNDPHHDYPAIDISIATGTPISAIRGGVVDKVTETDVNCLNECGSRGLDHCGLGVVVLDGDGVRWSYCHASELAVTIGQQVTVGELLMLAGNTGNSTGPHLHLGINADGKRCPQTLLAALYATGAGIDPRSLPASGCTY